MKKQAMAYGELPARTGLTLSMGPLPEPVPMDAADVVLPDESWALDSVTGQPTKNVCDADGNVVAKLTTQDIILESL